jgi:hypothetical protein
MSLENEAPAGVVLAPALIGYSGGFLLPILPPSAGLPKIMDARAMTPKLAQRFAKATGLAASAGAVLSIAWWIDPAFADATGAPVMLAGFVFTFAGAVVVIWVARRRGGKFARELSAPWRLRPRLLRGWLALVTAAAVISGGVAAVESGGYSQNPPGELAQCKWSINKDHGQTNICVSHDRWLATGEDFQRIFVGILVLLLVFQCTSFTRAFFRDPPARDSATLSFS